MTGSYNNINVLRRYQVFYMPAEDNALVVYYEINDHAYNKGYYFDDIYPDWSTLLKKKVEKKKMFSKKEKGCSVGCGEVIWCAPIFVNYCSIPC
jgi:hypothetical protein